MDIREYYEHNNLLEFYVSRGLELENGYDIIPLFSYVMEDNKEIIGASTCYKKGNDFIIDSIAIKRRIYRKKTRN